jgi:hypothetical protein
MNKLIVCTLAGLALLGTTAIGGASPVHVTYLVSGSSGDWDLNFSVTDNLGGTTGIYFFGVALPATDIVGSPSGWAYPSFDNPWTNAPYGGSSTVYNNPWCAATCSGDFSDVILPGQTLSGFVVEDTAVVAPSSVQWFAYAHGGTYTGGGNFGGDSYPGFEGTAGILTATPLPSTWTMLIAGFVGLAFFAYRGTKKNAAALAA